MDYWIGLTLFLVGFVLILLYIGVTFLMRLEVRTPGLFLTLPGAVLITLGIISFIDPKLLLSSESLIASGIVAFVTVVVTIMLYQKLVPPEAPTTTVTESLVGREGIVISDVTPNSIKGKVKVDGQIWSATSEAPIEKGAKIRVVKGRGVHVIVEKVESEVKNQSKR